MKKMILLSMILPLLGFAQTLPDVLPFNSRLEIPTASVSVSSAQYTSGCIVTNESFEWVYTVETNGGSALENYATEVVTNRVQAPVVTIETNAPLWTVVVRLDLRDYVFALVPDAEPGRVDRLLYGQRISVDPAVIQSYFGADYSGICRAALNGYAPKGDDQTAFLYFAASVLLAAGQ